MRNGHEHLAGLGIELADGVLAEVKEPFFVHGHAVPLLGFNVADDVAVLIAGAIMPGDVDHGRRMGAAIGDGRIQLRFDFDAGEIVGAVVDPDVVVLIDGQAGDAAHLPLVGQRLGPTGIDFVFRRRFRLRSPRGRCKRR